jgi:hypothetical protein
MKSWTVAFVVGDRESKALVLEIARNVQGTVEEVGEPFLEIRVARHLVRVASLALGDNASPLEFSQIARVQPLSSLTDSNPLSDDRLRM